MDKKEITLEKLALENWQVSDAIRQMDAKIGEQAKELEAAEERIKNLQTEVIELKEIIMNCRMYASKMADDWEKSAVWLDKKGYNAMLSNMIVVKAMLEWIFKETEGKTDD